MSRESVGHVLWENNTFEHVNLKSDNKSKRSLAGLSFLNHDADGWGGLIPIIILVKKLVEKYFDMLILTVNSSLFNNYYRYHIRLK